jgi:hypothetical protein
VRPRRGAKHPLLGRGDEVALGQPLADDAGSASVPSIPFVNSSTITSASLLMVSSFTCGG